MTLAVQGLLFSAVGGGEFIIALNYKTFLRY